MKSPNSVLCLALGLLLAVGCQTDSPTEPRPAGPQQPVVPPPVTAFTVTVTANPPQIVQGSNGTSTITVQVRRTDTGAPPPDRKRVRSEPPTRKSSANSSTSKPAPSANQRRLVPGSANAAKTRAGGAR